ncbi:MAG TPA: nuclear transport factor 2 family protein [Caulobacteraceae bacterium]|nr:nuclear transport factor 2 family protein [Caulobacteraceae bacterium]
MAASAYSTFSALDSFFDIVMEGLRGHVDGEHYFDALADDVVFEFRYRFPGWPSVVEGRKGLMDLYAGYAMTLESSGGLIVHRDRDAGVFTLEYEVHGVSPSGRPYDNRFVSVVEVRRRKITRWRDYMDSLAAMTAIRGPAE